MNDVIGAAGERLLQRLVAPDRYVAFVGRPVNPLRDLQKRRRRKHDAAKCKVAVDFIQRG
jgi:hypothetical protein